MSDQNLFQDLSGVVSTSTDPNPYNALIEACKNDPTEIKARYNLHRITRAKQQRAILLSPDFQGVYPDPILRGLLDEDARPTEEKTGYVDPRHCLVFWARPPERVRQLVAEVQQRLKTVVPNMWFMPPPNLHLTALEIAHSLTPTALASLEHAFAPLVTSTTDLLHTKGRVLPLSAPVLMFDASAVALSFLPCAANPTDTDAGGVSKEEPYTYHHLRRDIWDACSSTATARIRDPALHGAGVPIASRYVVPSCHLTVGRFVTHVDTSLYASEEVGAPAVDPERTRAFVRVVDEINAWLEREFWKHDAGAGELSGTLGASAMNENGNAEELNRSIWTPGEEVGLELRRGTVWYGGGNRVRLGRRISKSNYRIA